VRIDPKGTDPLSKALSPITAEISGLSKPAAVAPAGVKGLTAVASTGKVLDGVKTTLYTYSMNAAQLKAQTAALPPQLRDMMKQSGVTSVVTRYYVDSSYLPHQVVFIVTVKKKKTVETIRYSHWGEPVAIAAPPASDVVDSSEIG